MRGTGAEGAVVCGNTILQPGSKKECNPPGEIIGPCVSSTTGYSSGMLSCSDVCTFDTSSCKLTEPLISVNSGTYFAPLQIIISAPTPDAIIRYTIDGTSAGPTSPVYTAPLTLSEAGSVSLQTFAENTSSISSEVVLRTYNIQIPEFTITGTVNFLREGNSLLLANQDSEQLWISAGETFVFHPLEAETDYDISVLEQPVGQHCWVTNGRGVFSTLSVTDVEVTCTLAEKSQSALQEFVIISDTYSALYENSLNDPIVSPITIFAHKPSTALITLSIPYTYSTIPDKFQKLWAAVFVDYTKRAESLKQVEYEGYGSCISIVFQVELNTGPHVFELRVASSNSDGAKSVIDARNWPVTMTATVLNSLSTFLSSAEVSSSELMDVETVDYTSFGLPEHSFTIAQAQKGLTYLHSPASVNSSGGKISLTLHTPALETIQVSASGHHVKSETFNSGLAAGIYDFSPGDYELSPQAKALSGTLAISDIEHHMGLVLFDDTARVYSARRTGSVSNMTSTTYVPIQDLSAIDISLSKARHVWLGLVTDMTTTEDDAFNTYGAITIDDIPVAECHTTSQDNHRWQSISCFTIEALDAGDYTIAGKWKTDGVGIVASMGSEATNLMVIVLE
jgi:hypothetical protein